MDHKPAIDVSSELNNSNAELNIVTEHVLKPELDQIKSLDVLCSPRKSLCDDDSNSNPYMNGIILDEIDNSGLYYAYQEDIVTTHDTEEIVTVSPPVVNTHNDPFLNTTVSNPKIENFSLSPDHSYTSHKSFDDTKDSALNFYEKFCGDAEIIDSNDSFQENTGSNNLEVSEIVYVKAENGIDNIQEITLLVKPETDNVSFQESYKVLANGDSDIVEAPFKEIGLPRIANTRSLTSFPINYKILTSTGSKSLSNGTIITCDGSFGNQFQTGFTFETDEEDTRPPYSYSQLIVQAIASTKERQITLNGIYSFITEKYKYYRNTDEKGWKNSIRHNLSLNPHFHHVPRLPHPSELSRKGGYWKIDSAFEARLIKDAFAKKKKGYDNKKHLKYLNCNKKKEVNLPT